MAPMIRAFSSAIYSRMPSRRCIIMLALGIPHALFLLRAGLSFLGVGINDPIPSWGKMVSESLGYIRVYWYLGFSQH